MTGAVIYLFVSPSGRAYAGRHTCQHEGWSRRGSGALPSGYTGSGKLWQNVARKHGPNLRWIILRRFPEGIPRAQVDAAERRAVRLARPLWAGRCMNLLEGGEGLTSADASATWADPEHAAKVKAAAARPEVKAKVKAGLKAMWADPEHAAKMSAANKAAQNRPDVKARNSAASKALAQTPERRAFLASIQASANTPEAKAKAAATRASNKALRAMETQQ